MRVIPLYPRSHSANSYIICADRVCAVVDPGEDAERIFKRAENEGLKIEKILLTHCHFDHIMAVNELCALCSATVYIHNGDYPALYEPKLNLSLLGTGTNYVLDQTIDVVAVSDSDRIKLGDEEITVISTPGHTPGSCLYVFDNTIISGDTLFAGSIGRIDFPGGSELSMKKSLEEIKNLEGEYVLYSGHGPETTLSREKSSNYYLSESFLGK